MNDPFMPFFIDDVSVIVSGSKIVMSAIYARLHPAALLHRLQAHPGKVFSGDVGGVVHHLHQRDALLAGFAEYDAIGASVAQVSTVVLEIRLDWQRFSIAEHLLIEPAKGTRMRIDEARCDHVPGNVDLPFARQPIFGDRSYPVAGHADIPHRIKIGFRFHDAPIQDDNVAVLGRNRRGQGEEPHRHQIFHLYSLHLVDLHFQTSGR